MKQSLLITLLAALLLTLVPVSAQDAAFPVMIEHKFGSTTITEAPERVVAIGFTEQDTLLALGIMPVSVRYWYGDENDAIFAWAEDEAAALSSDQPVVLNMPFGTLNYEAILALDPDIITAVDSGITQAEYDALSQIAPVVAQPDDYIDFGTPWQEATRIIGAAVGKSAEAEALVSEVEGLFAEALEENPQFVGQEIVVAYNYGEDRTYGYYTDQDPRGRFFAQLGFVVPQELVEIAGEHFYADISLERIDLFNRDLLVFVGMQFAQGGREAIEADPIISQLDVVRDGRVIYIPAEVDDALQFSSVLSLEYALEGVLPELQGVFPPDATPEATEQPS